MEIVTEILKILLKDFTVKHTITSISKTLGVSRAGIWKILKRLESEKLVILSPIGEGKTSVYNVSLSFSNPLTEKRLELYLAEAAQSNERWLINFEELKDSVDFLIIYGSILHSPKDAGDIDILSVAKRSNLNTLNNAIPKLQKIQIKKIHALNFTEEELKIELKKKNKAFIDAIKKGVVLFGHEKFIKFIKEMA